MTKAASELFGDGGSIMFRDVFPGHRPRRVQAEFAAAIEACLEGFNPSSPSIALVQAETGIGKAMGYALPAALHALETGNRVIISTHTIELQNQLIRETLPLVSRVCKAVTGQCLSFGRRIGRRNFISLTALSERISRLDERCGREVKALLQSVLEYLSSDPTNATLQAVEERYGDWIRELGDLPFSFDEITLDRVEGDDAGFRDMVSRSHMLDILVVNHALLVTDLINHGRVLFPGAAEEAASPVLIVDEADALPDVAESMQFGKLPLFRLRSVHRILENAGSSEAPAVKKSTDKLYSALMDVAKEQASLVAVATTERAAILPAQEMGAKAVATVRDALTSIRSAIGTASTSLTPPDLTELRQVEGEIEGVLEGLDSLKSTAGKAVFVGAYWTPVRGMPGLYFAGATPQDIVSRLWRRNPDTLRPGAIAFVSATLSSTTAAADEPVNLSEFRHRVGLSAPWAPVSDAYSFAPDDFGTMDFVVIDQGLAPPVSLKVEREDTDHTAITNPAILPWWAGMVEAAAAGGERVLALTISYADANALAESLAGTGLHVILDRPGDKSGIRRFSEAPGSVFITPGKWAGIDLPGKIRNIVVTRIPFGPSDSVHNAHLEALLANVSPDRLLASRFPALLARARRKFLQGVGRGVRRADDRVTIWIGDARWPVPVGRDMKVKQPTWSRSFEQTVPARFRGALAQARVYDLLRGVGVYARKKSGLLSRR